MTLTKDDTCSTHVQPVIWWQLSASASGMRELIRKGTKGGIRKIIVFLKRSLAHPYLQTQLQLVKQNGEKTIPFWRQAMLTVWLSSLTPPILTKARRIRGLEGLTKGSSHIEPVKWLGCCRWLKNDWWSGKTFLSHGEGEYETERESESIV